LISVPTYTEPRYALRLASLQYSIALFLVVFMPFEGFILKWLPGPDRLYEYSRFITELLIYGLLAMVIGTRLGRGAPIRRTPIDVPLLSFVAVSLLTIAVRQTPFLSSIINLRTLLRYVALFYAIVHMDLETRQVRSMLVAIMVIAVMQALLGIMQHYVGIHPIWLPRETGLEIAGHSTSYVMLGRGREIGAAIGTMSDSIMLAVFLINSLMLFMVVGLAPRGMFRIRTSVWYASMAILFVATAFTYSRIATILATLCIPLVLVCTGRRQMIHALAVMVAVLGLGVFVIAGASKSNLGSIKLRNEQLSPFQNVQMIFTADYFAKAKTQRMGTLARVGGLLVRSGHVIGFGPDAEFAKTRLVDRDESLYYLYDRQSFEDVYWIAMFAYYGAAGLALYLWMLWRIFITGLGLAQHGNNPMYVVLGSMAAAIVVVCIPMTFITRTFEFRTYGFYFWLFAGLMMNAHMHVPGSFRQRADEG